MFVKVVDVCLSQVLSEAAISGTEEEEEEEAEEEEVAQPPLRAQRTSRRVLFCC
jgi:hypothetical protein